MAMDTPESNSAMKASAVIPQTVISTKKIKNKKLTAIQNVPIDPKFLQRKVEIAVSVSQADLHMVAELIVFS